MSNDTPYIMPLDGLDLDSEITITLSWQRGGWLQRTFGQEPMDLDLGCYYELADGSRKLIDYLQYGQNGGGPRDASTRQGCYTASPWIWHTGNNPGIDARCSESIVVNPQGLRQISALTLYAYIYTGAARWAESRAKLTIDVPGCGIHEIELGKVKSERRFCVMARIEASPGALTVKRVMTLHEGHADADRHYGWGFKYRGC